jgi:hypothetical protein
MSRTAMFLAKVAFCSRPPPGSMLGREAAGRAAAQDMTGGEQGCRPS